MNIDFKTYDHRDSRERGVTLRSGKGRVFIYLQHHETIEDILATIAHESIHYCIWKEDMADIDDYQEHDLIFTIQWIDEYI